MAHMSPGQIAARERIEAMIGVAAPFLDLVLGVGDRISRIVEPSTGEHYPIRSGGRVALPGEPDYDEDSAPPLPPEASGTG